MIILFIVLSFICLDLLGWSIHRLMHSNLLGIPFYKLHFAAHHRIDYLGQYKLNIVNFVEHGIWFLCMVVVVIPVCLLLPGFYGLVLLIESFMFLGMTYVLHTHYHRTHSWLNKYQWFKHSRKLHLIHHQANPKHGQPDNQLRRSVNYGFGNPITRTLCDQVFQTLQTEYKQGLSSQRQQ